MFACIPTVMPPSIRLHPSNRLRETCLGLILLALGTGSHGVAQNVILAPEPEQLQTASQRLQNTPPPPSRPPAPPETPYRLGPVILHPRLSYKFLNADGIPTRSGGRVTSDTHTLSAGLTADLSEQWTVSYGTSRTKQSADELGNTVDHFANLVGALSLGDIGLQFSQDFSKTTPTSIETGSQTEMESWSTSMSASYSLSQRIQMSGSVGMNERYSSVAPMIRSWTGGPSISWIYSNRLSLSFNPSFSYNEVRAAADTYSESYLGSLNWQPANKLTLSLGAGRQFTHSRSANALKLSSPLANLSIGYSPFSTTSFSASAAQTVAPTLLGNRVTENIRWRLGLQQRLLGKLYASVDYTRYRNDYEATDLNGQTNREDTVEAYSLRLSTRLFERLSLSVSAQRNKNTSNVAVFSFSSRQYGADVSWAF